MAVTTDEMLNSSQVAELLGVHYRTIQRYVQDGKLNPITVKHRWQFRKKEVERLRQAKITLNPQKIATEVALAMQEAIERSPHFMAGIQAIVEYVEELGKSYNDIRQDQAEGKVPEGSPFLQTRLAQTFELLAHFDEQDAKRVETPHFVGLLTLLFFSWLENIETSDERINQVKEAISGLLFPQENTPPQ